MVVVYHLHPESLPGGFVGVDVFFVISGFLITTMLIERPPTGNGDLLTFWARRARRLLPASLLVLLVCLIATWAFLPTSLWQQTGDDVRAAALYFINWDLLSDSIDYLASGQAPTVIQHFWSLAVEEQFYLIWPVLILELTLLLPFLPFRVRPRRLYFAGLSVVVAASFAISIYLTAAKPAAAYFSTWTRIWELGSGGLLAVVAPALALRFARGPRSLPVLISTIGWILIALSGVIYSIDTAFPGSAALLPVGGAVLVIAGKTDFRWCLLRPVQWLGDVSYSVYLWHWPLFLLVPAALSRVIGTTISDGFDLALIVVATLLLSGLTKRFVEDPFRRPTWAPRRRSTFALAALGMAIVVAASAPLNLSAASQRKDDLATLKTELAKDDPCLGAGSLDPKLSCHLEGGPIVPSAAIAKDDRAILYRENAQGLDCAAQSEQNFKTIRCDYGKRDSKTTIVLFGNSHAAQMFPALHKAAKDHGWHIVTYIASSCAASYVEQKLQLRDTADECVSWVHRVIDSIRDDPPALTVFSNLVFLPAVGDDSVEQSYPKYVSGFRRALNDLSQAGRPILLIRDTPAPANGGYEGIVDCVASHPDRTDCAGPRSTWVKPDAQVDAAKQLPGRGITIVDLNDYICEKRRCYGENGGVMTYYDKEHLTATYSTTLAPYLGKAIVNILKKDPARG
jgi:peptidoglycan/LPS O-acetylase OafA/YrhL